MTAKRPRSVTLLGFGVLIIAAFSWIRAAQAYLQWAFIADLQLSVPPVYILVTGLLFGAAGLPIFWGLWRGYRWGQWGALVFGLLFAGFYWYDRLRLAVSGIRSTNAVFAGGATLLLLGILYWILFRRPAVQFFQTGRQDPGAR